MDFFEQQSKVQNSSFLLLLLFTVVVAVLTLLVAWSASIISNLVGFERDVMSLTPIGLLVAGFFWIAIGFGCFFRWLDVRGGGSRLAERFGAVPVKATTRLSQEKLLLAINAEMAIAASIAEPAVWVMPYEHPINAFVVGGGDNIALVVTQGALDALDREELQAVVGHEMGHIVQGDLAINMRLLMVLGGFMALNEVGDTIGENFVGDIFRVVGGICVFAGTVIRSAISRRREFLADAMAVQFTRNPTAMACALDTIREHHDPEHLQCRYRQELAHLCFYTRERHNWFARKLASHPRIADRINAIDPHFATKNRGRKRKADQAGDASSVNQANSVAGTPLEMFSSHPGAQLLAGTMVMASTQGNGGATTASATTDAITTATTSTQDVCENGFGIVGERLALMVPDAATSLAAVFALFASDEQSERAQYLNSIAFAYKKPFAKKVAMLNESMGAEFRRDPLKVLHHASGKLRSEVKPENRRHLLKNLEKLVEIEHETTLVNYACLTLLRRWLNADHPVLTQTAGEATHDSATTAETANAAGVGQAQKIPRLDTIAREIGLLLSLLLEASGNRSERNLEDYRRVMLSYTNDFIPLRSQHENGIVGEMKAAFEAMQSQPDVVRRAFVEHCREVIASDFQVTEREHLLITLFSVALDVDVSAQSPQTYFPDIQQAANL